MHKKHILTGKNQDDNEAILSLVCLSFERQRKTYFAFPQLESGAGAGQLTKKQKKVTTW